jgi:hypothetical protein
MLSRRKAIIAMAALPAAGTLTAAAREPVESGAESPPTLDLRTPAGNVTAYLKLRAAVDTRDVYYWFTGRLDLAVAGEPLRPIVDVETLILRRTEQRGPLEWDVTDWEASFYRDPETGEVAESLVNPATGRTVRPLHYREGPVRMRFSEAEPFIVNTRNVLPQTGKPFSYPWRRVGDDFWMKKSSYIEAQNWLQPTEWPLESSGERIHVSTHSILKGAWSEVQDPRVASARTDFAYTAVSGWLPWMQMGRTPGHVVWAEAGRKLFSLDEAPRETVAIVRRLHPAWFGRPEPWPEFTNMYVQYREQRRPG